MNKSREFWERSGQNSVSKQKACDPLLAAINEKLVPYVTAMSAINAEYADFAAKADVEINKANASVGKKKSASETTTE